AVSRASRQALGRLAVSLKGRGDSRSRSLFARSVMSLRLAGDFFLSFGFAKNLAQFGLVAVTN
ncbi:hypothetical protein LCGC14_2753600, partial [marine sediment metagenome]